MSNRRTHRGSAFARNANHESTPNHTVSRHCVSNHHEYCWNNLGPSGNQGHSCKSTSDQGHGTLYRQGAFEKTEAQLLGTLKACGEECSAPVKAKIWMYIGVVRVDGRHKPAQAKQAFEDAVKLDPGVQLDRAMASPEAASLFGKANGSIRDASPPKPLPAGVAASAPVAHPGGCKTDSECKGSRICENGQCIDPAQSATAPAVPGTMPPTTNVAQPAPAMPAVTPPTPAPAARSDGNIPVTFETPNEDRTYSISVVQQGRTQSCVAPCTLSLQQGAAYVTVGGDASFLRLSS